MGKRSDFKKFGEFAAWDLDAGCRRVVNQTAPGKRRLKKRLKRQERKRLKTEVSKDGNIYS